MLKNIFLKMVSFYRFCISPLLGRHCRFYPTCSQYLQEAVIRYGLFRGALKGLSRLLRCHPFSAGGLDPVTK